MLVFTALATPFCNGKICQNCFARLCDFQRQSNVDGVVCGSTTGEGDLLTLCEKKLLVTIAKQCLPHSQIWCGVGGANTNEAVSKVKFLSNLAIDGILLAPPSFVKCTPLGYLEHVKSVLSVCNLPIMLYNVPSRCNYSLPTEIFPQLKELGIRYVKDAGNDTNYTQQLLQYFTVFSGNDEILQKHQKMGVQGAISVVANVMPKLIENPSLNPEKLQILAQLSMQEVNPVAIKYMLYKSGIFDSYQMRLPLTQASEQTRKNIDEIWREL